MNEVVVIKRNAAHERVVGHGPFVMNIWDEIDQAVNDYNQGRFLTAT
jgi:redox-sensitive bicupin YhaK (pirin superfamily)